MSNRFNGKVAIVTGAGVGIGYEICRKLVAEGAKVVLNDIDDAVASKAAETISEGTGNCIAAAGDSSDLSLIRKMIAVAVDKFGKLDIAIANAGITLFGDFFTYSEESFYKVMKVNLGGSFFLAREAALQLKKQGTGGSILFTSSVTGHQAHKQLAAYSMTKAGIEMLARNMVIEVSEFGINCNAIAPGATLTERTLEDPEYETVWSKLTPLGRPSTTEDIANVALFLVSDHARQITGQTVVIDGGWSSISPSPYEK
jgi:glucose 1-dehydrogenase